MMLSTMSLDSLFLSLLISRPAAEKIRSDVEWMLKAHLISWPTKAQNIQNLENIW